MSYCVASVVLIIKLNLIKLALLFIITIWKSNRNIDSQSMTSNGANRACLEVRNGLPLYNAITLQITAEKTLHTYHTPAYIPIDRSYWLWPISYGYI